MMTLARISWLKVIALPHVAGGADSSPDGHAGGLLAKKPLNLRMFEVAPIFEGFHFLGI